MIVGWYNPVSCDHSHGCESLYVDFEQTTAPDGGTVKPLTVKVMRNFRVFSCNFCVPRQQELNPKK